MASFLNFKFSNPFSRFFDSGKSKEDVEVQTQTLQHSQGQSQEEIDTGAGQHDAFQTFGINFDQLFTTKRSRVAKYREMTLYPEVSEALDNVIDDAIVEDNKGQIVTLE